MSRHPRRAAKRDIAEEPIVEALTRAGYHVYQVDQPCDLLVRKSDWPGGRFQALEVKSGRAKPKPSQTAQITFLETTRTPVVRNVQQALEACDNAHTINGS